MIIRLFLFIILLASFYYYCDDGSSPGQMNSPNDMNMIEIPKDFEPEFSHDVYYKAWLTADSSNFMPNQNYALQKSQHELASRLR